MDKQLNASFHHGSSIFVYTSRFNVSYTWKYFVLYILFLYYRYHYITICRKDVKNKNKRFDFNLQLVYPINKWF